MVDFISNFKRQNKQLGSELKEIGKKIKKAVKNSVYTGPLAKKKKSKRAPGSANFKPTDTTRAPSYMKKVKPSKPGNIKKATIYKSKAMTGSPYGEADLAGKGRRGKPKGNIGKVQQITEDTKYGGMQKKKETIKKKTETKKKSRGLVTMTSMQNKYL